MDTGNHVLAIRREIEQFQIRFMREIYPVVKRHARRQFRNCSPDHRREGTQEAVAAAWQSSVRLVERGKDPAKFPSRIARYAVLFVRNGRHVGGRQNHCDVMSWHRQQRNGHTVESLGDYPHDSVQPWQQILAEDKRTTPADVAVIRLDLVAWLRILSPRNCKLVKNILMGETTRDLAAQFAISAARVSQLRREFVTSWKEFQGESDWDARQAVVG